MSFTLKNFRKSPLKLGLSIISLGLSCGLFAKEADAIVVIIPKYENYQPASNADLLMIYLRQRLYWTDGKPIHPVNLTVDNRLRQVFSSKVIGMAPEDLSDFWSKAYFDGIMPPYTVKSHEAMIRYIEQTPGSIGYIDACSLDNRVKGVAWLIDTQLLLNPPTHLNCPSL